MKDKLDDWNLYIGLVSKEGFVSGKLFLWKYQQESFTSFPERPVMHSYIHLYRMNTLIIVGII